MCATVMPPSGTQSDAIRCQLLTFGRQAFTLTKIGIFVTVRTHSTKFQVSVSSMLLLKMLTVPAALILSCGCILSDNSLRFSYARSSLILYLHDHCLVVMSLNYRHVTSPFTTLIHWQEAVLRDTARPVTCALLTQHALCNVVKEFQHVNAQPCYKMQGESRPTSVTLQHGTIAGSSVMLT